MGNNHGFTPGYINSAEEQRLAALDWRIHSAINNLKRLDPKFLEWMKTIPLMTDEKLVEIFEERISILKSLQVDT